MNLSSIEVLRVVAFTASSHAYCLLLEGRSSLCTGYLPPSIDEEARTLMDQYLHYMAARLKSPIEKGNK